jgi:drug/metabolite transporter (DMT)-like permease
MSRYIVMVFAGACSFGILSTFVKLAYADGYTAAEIAFSQAGMGMLVLWALGLLSMQKHPFRLNTGGWAALLLTGAFIGLTTFAYYLSVQYIAASLAIVLLMQFSWMGMLLDWLLFKKRPSRQALWATGLVLAGTLPAAGISVSGINAVSITGVLYALLSALLYAVYVVANSRSGNHLHPLQKSAVVMTGSMLGIFLLNAPALLQSLHFDYGLLKWTLFLSLFGTIIPPVLFSKGIPRIGAGISGVVMTAELPVAVICSHLVLNERISALQWLGVAVMLVAIALLNKRKSGG